MDNAQHYFISAHIIKNQFVALEEIFKFVRSNWKQDSHSMGLRKIGVFCFYN